MTFVTPPDEPGLTADQQAGQQLYQPEEVEQQPQQGNMVYVSGEVVAPVKPVQTVNTMVVYTSNQEPSCGDVFCLRSTPILENRAMQIPCAVAQLLCGCGLECSTCCCCYGCDRPSCCPVWCAGFCLNVGVLYIYGLIASIIIAVKMMLI